MKHLMIVLALTTLSDANAGVVMSMTPALIDDLVIDYPHPTLVQRYQNEGEWRRGHPEIPRYAPYVPDYGWYSDPNGQSRFQGTPNRYWREEYPPIQYHYIYRCWAYGACARR